MPKIDLRAVEIEEHVAYGVTHNTGRFAEKEVDWPVVPTNGERVQYHQNPVCGAYVYVRHEICATRPRIVVSFDLTKDQFKVLLDDASWNKFQRE